MVVVVKRCYIWNKKCTDVSLESLYNYLKNILRSYNRPTSAES